MSNSPKHAKSRAVAKGIRRGTAIAMNPQSTTVRRNASTPGQRVDTAWKNVGIAFSKVTPSTPANRRSQA